jgi:hypothetical protein
MSGPVGSDDTSVRLRRAIWLLGLVVKLMVEREDGSAHVVLPAPLVDTINDIVTELATPS